MIEYYLQLHSLSKNPYITSQTNSGSHPSKSAASLLALCQTLKINLIFVSDIKSIVG